MTDSRQDVLAVIPSRMGAQRFPGKPLARIASGGTAFLRVVRGGQETFMTVTKE